MHSSYQSCDGVAAEARSVARVDFMTPSTGVSLFTQESYDVDVSDTGVYAEVWQGGVC
jgi:hypothetical protein